MYDTFFSVFYIFFLLVGSDKASMLSDDRVVCRAAAGCDGQQSTRCEPCAASTIISGFYQKPKKGKTLTGLCSHLEVCVERRKLLEKLKVSQQW